MTFTQTRTALTELPLGTLAPGHRIAHRRHVAVRPGDDDFLEMQMLELAEHVRLNPGVQALFGREIEIKFAIGDRGRVLQLQVRKAPPIAKPRRDRTKGDSR